MCREIGIYDLRCIGKPRELVLIKRRLLTAKMYHNDISITYRSAVHKVSARIGFTPRLQDFPLLRMLKTSILH